MNRVYKEIIQAKNGTFIPVLESGKTIESKYNPENSINITLQALTTSNPNLDLSKSNFWIVTGIGCGLLIKKLLELNPNSFVLGIEINDEDISFLKNISTVSNLALSNRVIFSNVDNLKDNIINSYIPVLFNTFQVVTQQVWLQETTYYTSKIANIIQDSLKIISADFSVQSHFGKLWQKNILSNLHILEKLSNQKEFYVDNHKTAAIIAAGPSLDKTITTLKEKRNEYIIFSTDTALSSLLKYKISPDFVISIDGQFISTSHFINSCKNTIFLFDLCANFSAAKKIINHNKLYYFISGHPFCNLINEYSTPKLPKIYNGSGTVTISAIDVALKLGFKQIEIFGADFSYMNGKSYTKGTYLDTLYLKNSNRIFSSEKNFDKLLYRTELINISEHIKTTEVLNSYKTSLEDYLINQKCKFKKNNDRYEITSNASDRIKFSNQQINTKLFINDFLKLNVNLQKNYLLPLLAYLRKNNPSASLEELTQLALTFIVRYN